MRRRQGPAHRPLRPELLNTLPHRAGLESLLVSRAGGVWAKATVHLSGGLRPGHFYFVNPDAPWVRDQIANDFLVPESEADDVSTDDRVLETIGGP